MSNEQLTMSNDMIRIENLKKKFEKNEALKGVSLRLGEGTVAAVMGPNGSGKSSMLDAVQIAMLGANSRLVALNAQADEQATTRSLRAYCLGQYGESPEHRARENATTYITLVWRDSETGFASMRPLTGKSMRFLDATSFRRSSWP